MPIVVVDARTQRAVGIDTIVDAVGDENTTSGAVLLYTAADEHWGEEKYALGAPYVTAAAADWLARRRPALVGIDSVNIDDLQSTTTGRTPSRNTVRTAPGQRPPAT